MNSETEESVSENEGEPNQESDNIPVDALFGAVELITDRRKNMNWKYVKALKSANLIDEFETLVCYELPKEFKECVLQYNGGRPERKGFDTDANKGRELKSFLSFNKEDRETVWKIHEWNKGELANKYFAFAIDNFGNLICFDMCNILLFYY